MASAKVRVKAGEFEVEFEGDEEFARTGVIDLLRKAIEVSVGVAVTEGGPDVAKCPPAGVRKSSSKALSVSTIAAHLDPDGTQDLVMCALAKLQLIDGKSQASKEEIWEEMKGATGYFKSAMGRNFPRDLGRMVKGKKINEIGSQVYSLAAQSAKDLEAKLADIG